MSKNSLQVAEEKLRSVFKKNKIAYEDVEVKLDPSLLTDSLPHWSTGSIAVDYLIGGRPNSKGISPCPGIPKGKIINLYGLEASGKSTMALTMAASINRQGGTVAYIDCEHEVDLNYAKTIGVAIEDKDKFRLYQPETMEQALAIALTCISSGVHLIVWDSVGAALPEAEHDKSEKEMGDAAKIGAVAKKWSEKLPMLKARASKTGSIFLGIAQMRQNIGIFGHGDKYTVQGGLAWKYNSTIRMKLVRVQWDKADMLSGMDNTRDQGVVGQIVEAKLDKCKVSAQQNMKIQFYVRFGEGIDNLRTLLETASKRGIIKKGGSWLTWNNPTGDSLKLQGMEKFRDHFLAHPKDADILKDQVFKEVFSNIPVPEGEEEDSSEVFEGEEDTEESLDDELEGLLG